LPRCPKLIGTAHRATYGLRTSTKNKNSVEERARKSERNFK
jgi:hypothetical protein